MPSHRPCSLTPAHDYSESARITNTDVTIELLAISSWLMRLIGIMFLDYKNLPFQSYNLKFVLWNQVAKITSSTNNRRHRDGRKSENGIIVHCNCFSDWKSPLIIQWQLQTQHVSRRPFEYYVRKLLDCKLQKALNLHSTKNIHVLGKKWVLILKNIP